MTANGDTPITFTEAGKLPTGVTLSASGTLSGTPALATGGSYPVTITATDANANTSTQSFTLTVTATGPSITSAASTTFAENTAGTFPVTATGDTPITFTESGKLPTGVTLATSGTLSGTPSFGTAGSYPVTITATDANANKTTQAFTLTVTATGPSITSAASTTFTVADAGTFAVMATGDTPITFTESGTLPSGVSLATNGTLSGTPAAGTAGSYPILLTATDAFSSTATQAFTLTVDAAPSTSVIVPSSQPDLSGTSATLDATASSPVGISKVQFVITGGSYNKTVIGTATSTVYGYYFPWNTTTVPGGTYTVQSLATDAQGGTGYSSPVMSHGGQHPTDHGGARPRDRRHRERHERHTRRQRRRLIRGSDLERPVRAQRRVVQQDGDRHRHHLHLRVLPLVEHDGRGERDLHAPEPGHRRRWEHCVQHGDHGYGEQHAADHGGTRPRDGRKRERLERHTRCQRLPAELGSASVQFVLSGGSYNKTVIGTATSSAYGYYLSWNTTGVANGTYTLQSLATDVAGNTTYSTAITVTVNNTPPTTAVLVPATGATVSGTSATLDASASAANGVGISKVQFVLSGGSYNKTVIGTATTSIYGYYLSWNTTGVANGTYTLQSLATDGSGNTTYSTAITIKVSN